MRDEQWLNILVGVGNKVIELATTPTTNAKPKWFSVERHGYDIYIDKAINHKPSSEISSTRKLNEKNFLEVLPYYYDRKDGKQVSQIVSNLTMNQVYYYSLIHNFIDN